MNHSQFNIINHFKTLFYLCTLVEGLKALRKYLNNFYRKKIAYKQRSMRETIPVFIGTK